MMYRSRPSRQDGVTRWLLIMMLGVIVVGGWLIYRGLNSETVKRRLEAVPLYARAYLNQLRPTPEIPAPPAVSAIAPESLLQNTSQLEAQTQAGAAIVERAGGGAIPDQSVAGQPSSQNDGSVVLAQSSVLTARPIAPQVTLSGINHEWQTWNNCGPVTIAMNLSYYGRTETQVDSAPFLKPNKEDKNVSPRELAAYARTLGYEAVVRVGGDLNLLKQLLSNGFPVIVEFWLNPEDNGGLGHYRLFTGYSEAGGYFVAEDSLNGTGIQVPFTEFDPFWRVFNRAYMVVYPPDQTALVHAILGRNMADQAMLEKALNMAQAEAQIDPANPYAWFNIGTSYARLGQPELAASAFDQARRIGLPYRMLWYQFDLFESYLAVGRYQEVIDLSTAVLKATGGLEELYYYRGLAGQALGQTTKARDDFHSALDYNTNFSLAADALRTLDGSE
jgi:tetratricopeptide (TPR) repeat protein